MAETQHTDRLLSIIEAQNRIAAWRLDPEAVMELVVERARALTGADAVVLELGQGDEMVYGASSGTVTAPGGASSMACVPLLQDEQPRGALKAYSAETHAFADDDIEILELLGSVLAAQLASSHAYQPGDDRDPLTALGNGRAYEERLEAECSRARRHGDPLTLCLLDLNGLEQINESHGRPAGDELLRQVAETLGRLRTEDMAFRIGNDEFAVLLPATTAEQARIPVERLAAHIGARSFGATSASFGLADAPLEPDGLHAAAGAQLLAAKAGKQPVSARS